MKTIWISSLQNLRLILIALLMFVGQACLQSQSKFWTPVTPPLVHYDLSIQIDVEKDFIQGSGQISFKNNGVEPIGEIAFDWPQTGRFTLEVRQGGVILELINPRITSSEPCLFKLDKAIGKNGAIDLEVTWHRDGFTDGDELQIYLNSKLYPMVWWDGVLSADHYKVKVDYPEGYQIAATGKATDVQNQFEVERTRNFAVYLGKNQKSFSKVIEGVQLTVIYPEDGVEVGKIAYDITLKAIPFFVKKYGFFPFSYFTIIPGDTRGPWGGYNFAPGIGVIHGMKHFAKRSENFWKWITIHEICHHYWGEYVLDADNPSWLWIGLGIYADQSFLEEAGIEYSIYRNFQEQYFYQGVQKHVNTTLAITPGLHDQFSEIYDWNNTTKHGKGYTVIKALECAIGKKNMNELMAVLLKKYAWLPLNSTLFQREAEMVSGENLDWFFSQWVRSNRYLSVFVSDSLSVREGDHYQNTVTVQHQGSLLMPIPVSLHFEDGSIQTYKTERISRQAVISCISNAPLQKIELDPDHLLPIFPERVIPTPEELDNMVGNIPYSDVGDDADPLLAIAEEIDTPLASTWFQLGLRLYEPGKLAQSFGCYKKGLSKFQQESDTSGMVKSLCWMGMIKDELGERERAIEYYQQALGFSYDGAFMYGHFSLLINRDWINERLQLPYLGMKRIYRLK